ncbi:MAG: hypothetical protein PSV16_11300 [Flavobacterium sp.]|nr:hypothetical protein [Flavobacterium sp.]
MKKTIVAFGLLFILVLACKKESTILEPISSQELPQTTPSTLKKENLAESIVRTETDLILNLKSADTEKANQLYDIFRAKMDTLVKQINIREEFLTDNYYSIFYDEKNKKNTVPDAIKAKMKFFEMAGLEISEVGEGFVEIRKKPYYFYNLFKNYVSEDYKEYLKLEAEDNAELFQADAEIIVSLEEVTHRTLKWEQFLNRFPKSRQFKNARKTYGDYLYAFLVGYDNTPVITDDRKSIYPENQKEFDKVIAEYPETVTAKMIAFLYKMLAKSYDNNLNDAIGKEQQQYLTGK